MISLRETVTSIYGAYRLVYRDPSGLAHFNVSVQGFWHSFFALAFIAPLFWLDLYTEFATVPIAAQGMPFGDYLFERTAGYTLSWLVFPLAMYYITRFFDLEKNFLRFMIAYNWATVIQAAVVFPLSILIALGVIPEGLASFAGIVIFIALLTYAWYVAKVSLDVDGMVAMGIVMLDLTINWSVEIAAMKLF